MRTFREILNSMVELYEAKNYDYAKGGSEHGNFERVASILANYPNLPHDDPCIVALTYMLKQLDAILWAKNIGYQTEVETLDDKFQDIGVYAIIARMINAEQEAKTYIEQAVVLDSDSIEEWQDYDNWSSGYIEGQARLL